jgi:bla regulator protein BlaR1
VNPRAFADLLHDAWPALANHLWQSTAFATVAASLAWSLRANQARVRYWIWMAASLKFLVPFALLAAAAEHLARPRIVSSTPANVYFVVDQLSKPFTVSPLLAQVSAHTAPPLHWGVLVLTVLWAMGVAAVLVSWGIRWRRIARLASHAAIVPDGREVHALERMMSLAGVAHPVRMRLSQEVLEPGVFGILRPVLLWPSAIRMRLDDDQLETVLAHELCHISRRDNITVAIHMFVEAVFWFHPLVWWLGARLLAERERACDEAVIALCPRPQVYAQSILAVCEFCVASPVPCISGVTGGELKQRIRQILRGGAGLRMTASKKLLLAVSAAAALVLPLIYGLMRPAVGVQAQSDAALRDAWEKAAGGSQSFEVASVREAKDPGRAHANFVLGPGNVYAANGGRFSAQNLPAVDLIRFAYKLTDGETALMQASGPSWLSEARLDIEARSENHQPTKDQMRLMVRSLLLERFGLKAHTEQREMAVFAMVLAKPGHLGPQLRPHPADGPPCSNLRSSSPAHTSDTIDGGYPALCGGMTDAGVAAVASHVRLGARDVPLKLLAANIGGLGRPLVDRTGLTGRYDFFFEWGPDPSVESGGAAASGTTLEQAMREQLGIKLVKEKGIVDVLVLDNLQRPSAQDEPLGPTHTNLP